MKKRVSFWSYLTSVFGHAASSKRTSALSACVVDVARRDVKLLIRICLLPTSSTSSSEEVKEVKEAKEAKEEETRIVELAEWLCYIPNIHELQSLITDRQVSASREYTLWSLVLKLVHYRQWLQQHDQESGSFSYAKILELIHSAVRVTDRQRRQDYRRGLQLKSQRRNKWLSTEQFRSLANQLSHKLSQNLDTFLLFTKDEIDTKKKKMMMKKKLLWTWAWEYQKYLVTALHVFIPPQRTQVLRYLRLGSTLVLDEKHWTMKNDPLHSKNPDVALALPLPEKLSMYMSFFVSHVRPLLTNGYDHGYVFVNRDGTGPRKSIYKLVIQTVYALVKVKTNPHLFRSVLISHSLTHRPAGVDFSGAIQALSTSMSNTPTIIHDHYLSVHQETQHALSQSLVDNILTPTVSVTPAVSVAPPPLSFPPTFDPNHSVHPVHSLHPVHFSHSLHPVHSVHPAHSVHPVHSVHSTHSSHSVHSTQVAVPAIVLC